MTIDLSLEQKTAVEAVRAAATVCRAIQQKMLGSPPPDAAPANAPEGVITKQDRSPVTIADFASQAVVCALLAKTFPNDPIIGEEHSAELRKPANASIRAAVVDHVRTRLGSAAAEADVLAWIDRGKTAGPTTKRFWTLDPIDGTKGFLRNGQYAVALALIIDGKVALGALACPNLPANNHRHPETANPQPGALFIAQRNQGAKTLPLWIEVDPQGATAAKNVFKKSFSERAVTVRERSDQQKQSPLASSSPMFDPFQTQPIHADRIADPKHARFCESVESGHSDQALSATIAAKLGITTPPLRMDSQAKYAAVARGDASIYLRLPTIKDYQEKIWDHAAGAIVIEEAGGAVTDIDGKPLNFSHGHTLAANRGVVATNTLVHNQVLQAVQSAISRQ